MYDKLRQKGREFAKFLDSLSDEERARGNEINLRQATEEYEGFKTAFKAGQCYVCRTPLASLVRRMPCPHWLLKPDGFEKSDVPAIAEKFGFFQIQSFLRWVANQNGFARNINDLREEGTGKLFETTIQYRNIEWSFSCAESDYLGHASSEHSKHAHYHLQVRIDKRQFINFGDFHLPFSEQDIVEIEAARAAPSRIKQRFSFGAGMGEILSDLTGERIVAESLPCSDQEGAFKIDTIVIAEEGHTISGDELQKIFQEAKAKGVTVASLLHKLPNVRTTIVVTPGPGVVEQAPRSGRRKGKRKDDAE